MARRIAYDFAIIRVVPHVYVGAFGAVGAILHSRTEEFLGARIITDAALLAQRFPGTDSDLLSRYLLSLVAICAGDVAAGPVALAPPSERFHWLTAPASTVIQTSAVHTGLAEDPEAMLEHLLSTLVLPPVPE